MNDVTQDSPKVFRLAPRRPHAPLSELAVLRTGFSFDTSPLPGWRMRSRACVCELVLGQPVTQRPLTYAIFAERAVLRETGTVLLARRRVCPYARPQTLPHQEHRLSSPRN